MSAPDLFSHKKPLLVRVRFDPTNVGRLDRMTLDIGKKLGRKIARAAVIRALAHLFPEELCGLDDRLLESVFTLDVVRRGRRARRPS